jgi:hypothetical protein
MHLDELIAKGSLCKLQFTVQKRLAAKSKLSRKILLTDRRVKIRSVLKVAYILRTKKHAQFGVYFSISIQNLTQSKISKRCEDIFLQRTLVSSLTLQISDIVLSSLESFALFAIFMISMFGHVAKGSQTL